MAPIPPSSAIPEKMHYYKDIYSFKSLVYLQKRAKAGTLLDKVFEHLELIEKDYFGLQYVDSGPTADGMVGHFLMHFKPWRVNMY